MPIAPTYRLTRFVSLFLALVWLAGNPLPGADLESSFHHPPPSAKPWVYWFPLDGNIASNGITADLEAMQRVGIGGVLYMETDQGAPTGPAAFAGPLWRDLFKHICSEASRLGLQVNMNNDAGWCGSGGPWITPELSMQRLVWSETKIEGPQHFDSLLAQPRATRDFYRDIAVFAYPTLSTNYVIPLIRSKSADRPGQVPLRTTYPNSPPESIVSRTNLLDLTRNLREDGILTWDVPPGRWTLLRIGHTTTGKDNHPAPSAGRGLECDKLSKEAAEVHFDNLMARLIADNRHVVGTKRTLVSTHIDSWEVGSQNWTPKFREEFRRRRGYDPLPLLPVMTGRVVDNVEISERFLWDVRQTVNDLLCENYAGHFRALAHRNGIRLSIEAYDKAPCDDLTYAGRADEPMAEFWSWGFNGSPWFTAYSCTEMSSAAHVYGHPILGAEAFTASNQEKWQGHPAEIKALGDWAFCEGINRFVFHRYALQPWTNPDRPPGMSMGPWGLHYERTQTWWEMSRAWHEYLARCQFLLQQGLFVADFCFLAPETSPQRFASPVKTGHDRPGYNFDGCPPEVVLTRMSVRDGRLTLPDGMSYRMLVLPRTKTMTPKLLRRIRDLVKAGATVLGAPPVKSPSLQDYPECDQQVTALAKELWGENPAPGGTRGRSVGKGHVIWPNDFRPKEDAPYDPESALRSAKWIWFKEGNPARSAPPGKRYFRRTFTLDGTVESGWLRMTADNSFECWVNGRNAAQGSDFHQAVSTNVVQFLRPGSNYIAVLAENLSDKPNPAGLIGILDIKYRDGRVQALRTDGSWEASKSPAGNWPEDMANRPNWSKAMELGSMGMDPWGDLQDEPGETDPIADIAIPSHVLETMGIPPDFRATSNIRYIHKRLERTDLYFVSNPEPHPVEAVCTFRVSGKQPEIWSPDTGHTQRAVEYEFANGCTSLPLRFDPSGSFFIVFREKAKRNHPRTAAKNWLEFQPFHQITNSWEATFDAKWGGPPGPVTFERLDDWSKSTDPAIRYYSGTAIYRTKFEIPSQVLPVGMFLNLGRVDVMAEVWLNGRNLGILWKAPFRVEVTDTLKPGRNTLELRVVNLWINRMIGDELLPEDSDRNPSGNLKSWPSWLADGKPSPTGRHTFTSWRLWKKDDPLVESGLLGPVTLEKALPGSEKN